MAMLVVHSRKFQTERPFPSSLPSLVWDLSSGNEGMHCEELLAMEWVLQQKQLSSGRLWRDGWSQGAGQGRGLWFLGAALLAVQEISMAMAPYVPALSCSGSPRGWGCRDRSGLAPAAASSFHSLLCTQQQPLCALLTTHPRGQSLFLSPSQMIVLACCFHGRG